MKYLITVIILSFFNHIYAACEVTDPHEHHLNYFELKKTSEFKDIKEHLNLDQDIDLIVTTSEQCGSRGCEYSIYQNLGSEKCYKFIGDITGKILSITNEIIIGYKTIVVDTSDGALSEKKIIKFSFNPISKSYKARGR